MSSFFDTVIDYLDHELKKVGTSIQMSISLSQAKYEYRQKTKSKDHDIETAIGLNLLQEL